MKTLDEIIKEISKEEDIDIQIVNDVCKHVFKFTVDTMNNTKDTQDILFNKLFKFKLKPRFKNNKSVDYSPRKNGKEEDN